MKKFTCLTGVAASLPMSNIDTDMIIPKQFLRTIKRTGLGKNLFDELRYDGNGAEKADFILNQEPYRNASILVAGENFGCGSSREHAPWALLDFGISCIISVSFADIFYNNCFKNGILPIVLDSETIQDIFSCLKDSNNCNITVDLELQTIAYNNNQTTFEIDSFRKECLLNGLDDIDLTLKLEQNISTYESNQNHTMPWVKTILGGRI